ncbi:MAG TPA: metallophosphoesterase family protein, partial [Vicinamibacterales bacterium]|nr:metallophosphoesterase family protein [Vicinamibacterales bacterium]
MLIGALGDIHGEFDTVHQIMTRHPDVTLWVQVGDVASNLGEYFAPIAPLYWIKGNNEDFDVVAAAMAGHSPAPTLYYLRNGGPHRVGPWRVAALGGTFAPSWYQTPASSLPASKGRRTSAPSLKLGKSRDDKRRHFVKEEVLACKALTSIDVFLTHEAPR